MSDALSKASEALLLSLREKLVTGRLQMPLTNAMLKSEGLGKLIVCLPNFHHFSAEGLIFLLDSVLAERKKAHAREPTLVWTGPEAIRSKTRDTWVVFKNLLENAQEHILIAGFRFDHGLELMAPLHDRMSSHELRVQIFLDVERNEEEPSLDEHLRKQLQRFMKKNWREGVKAPELYYNPASAEKTSSASMHAKCVVVDERSTLIGSANFTDRGQSRNFEMGVLIEDEIFAREMTMHWQSLIESGIMKSGNQFI